jgi:dolichyl-phosphate beta-glucosyltransferase
MPFEESQRGVYLSLIIPVFNEETRIGKSLDKVLKFLQDQLYTFETIIVDDGSSDQTVQMVKERFGQYPEIRIYRQPHNIGKGGAIRQGMLLGNGKYLFFSDADLSVPIETLPIFLSQLENHFDVTIGSRQKTGAVIEVHQPFYREMMGKTYTKLSNWILGLKVSDVTCGLKGFRREAARELFSRQRLRNWSFDAEILYLARLKGYRVHEIPVKWRDDRATKVRLWRDVWSSFLGLLKVRFYDYQGRYQ